MKLTKEQKAAVARIIQNAVASADHQLVHSDNDERRDFYRRLAAEARGLLPLFKGREVVEIEEDEEEEEED